MLCDLVQASRGRHPNGPKRDKLDALLHIARPEGSLWQDIFAIAFEHANLKSSAGPGKTGVVPRILCTAMHIYTCSKLLPEVKAWRIFNEDN